ncbi:MAG TPA: hypothetical protein VMR33_18255 [Candidatus Baltobacteraceae bacterium]|jgi:hypothetical protein|nr:hypothetical protein [Candidatus Baltobacteraceae bacterium]
MNPEFDKQLEAEIDRALKDLPDLAAPPNLLPRTLSLIARPAAPWHARPWSAWPVGLRAAYLVVTLGAVAAAIPGWRAVGPRLLAPIVGRLAHWRAGVECLWNAVGALTGAVALILDRAGKGIILPCILVVVLAYAACVGFGTVFVRLSMSKFRKI